MATITLELQRLHQSQQEIKQSLARYNVVNCGRRWGKTQLGIDFVVGQLLRGWPVGWFAPTYKILAPAWRELRAKLAPVAKPRGISVQEKRIEIVTGGVLEMWSLDNADAGRSRKYKRVIVDEAAMARHLKEAWEDSIRPTLTDYVGDATFFSTPKGRNYFWELFQRGGDEAAWHSWQMPTSANPHIPAEEIEAARRELPERTFRQEYLAEFLEDGGGVFRHVAALSTLQATPPIAGRTYVGGIDWARSDDFTVFSLFDADTRQQVALERFNNIDYEIQMGRLRAMHERYNVRTWIAEYNSMGGPLVERLQREELPVLPFQTTNATKMHIVDGLALAMERRDITLLNDENQQHELIAYEAERLPSGALRYGAPSGMHDDTVIALALAVFGINESHQKKATRQSRK